MSAINKALDASPHENQNESIRVLKKLSDTLENYPDTKIVFIWLPRKAPFIGFKRAKQLALKAIRTADTSNIIEPHTISSQKKATKDAAIAEWTTQWHQQPHTSKAYQTALTEPPDGLTHRTFLPTPAHNTPGEDNTDKFSRLTDSTFYRFVTGHAFTGDVTGPWDGRAYACSCTEISSGTGHGLLTDDCLLLLFG